MLLCIERQLNLWKDGNLNDLALEGCTIRQRLNDKILSLIALIQMKH